MSLYNLALLKFEFSAVRPIDRNGSHARGRTPGLNSPSPIPKISQSLLDAPSLNARALKLTAKLH